MNVCVVVVTYFVPDSIGTATIPASLMLSYPSGNWGWTRGAKERETCGFSPGSAARIATTAGDPDCGSCVRLACFSFYFAVAAAAAAALSYDLATLGVTATCSSIVAAVADGSNDDYYQSRRQTHPQLLYVAGVANDIMSAEALLLNTIVDALYASRVLAQCLIDTFLVLH